MREGRELNWKSHTNRLPAATKTSAERGEIVWLAGQAIIETPRRRRDSVTSPQFVVFFSETLNTGWPRMKLVVTPSSLCLHK